MITMVMLPLLVCNINYCRIRNTTTQYLPILVCVGMVEMAVRMTADLRIHMGLPLHPGTVHPGIHSLTYTDRRMATMASMVVCMAVHLFLHTGEQVHTGNQVHTVWMKVLSSPDLLLETQHIRMRLNIL